MTAADIDEQGSNTPLKGINHDNLQEILFEANDEEEENAPDGGWGWACVFGCAMMHMFVIGNDRAFGLIYLELQNKFGGSSALTAWVGGVAVSLRFGLGPLAALLTNHFNYRVVVMAGGILVFIGVLSSAFVQSLPYLYVTWGVILGVGGALSYSPSYIAIGEYFDKRRAIANGLASAGSGLGAIVVPQICRILLENFSYSGTMLVMAALLLNVINCGALYRPLRKKASRKNIIKSDTDIEQRERLTSENNGDIQGKNSIKKCSGKNLKQLLDYTLLYDSNFLLYAVFVGTTTMAYMSIPTFMPALAIEKGISWQDSSYLLSAYGISNMCGRLSSGFIFDNSKIRPYRRYIYNATPFFISFSCMVFPLARGLVGFIVISLIYGLSNGLFVAQIASILVDVVGSKKLASSIGILTFFRGIGNMLSPVIAGHLKDITGSYDYLFYYTACLAALAGFIFLILNLKHYRKRPISNNKCLACNKDDS